MFRKILDEGRAGENVGLLLRGTKKDDVERGMVVIKPGSATPHTDFDANVYVLTKEEGGRHKPFFSNYSPQFYFRTTDVTGIVQLPEGTDMVMPGDNTDMTVHLNKPIAMEDGLKFAIREGGRTVGAGRVTRSSSEPDSLTDLRTAPASNRWGCSAFPGAPAPAGVSSGRDHPPHPPVRRPAVRP